MHSTEDPAPKAEPSLSVIGDAFNRIALILCELPVEEQRRCCRALQFLFDRVAVFRE